MVSERPLGADFVPGPCFGDAVSRTNASEWGCPQELELECVRRLTSEAQSPVVHPALVVEGAQCGLVRGIVASSGRAKHDVVQVEVAP
jgi:hypothetical protein